MKFFRFVPGMKEVASKAVLLIYTEMWNEGLGVL